MQGKCLCGLTSFQLNVPFIKAYQCHCSLCRKQSGTASNLGAIIPTQHFSWLSNRDHIKRWVKETGFTSDFCSNCGSPVPNVLRGMDYYWVPVGTMDTAAPVEIVAHLCTSSMTEWDSIPINAVQYEELPDVATFIKNLNSW